MSTSLIYRAVLYPDRPTSIDVFKLLASERYDCEWAGNMIAGAECVDRLIRAAALAADRLRDIDGAEAVLASLDDAIIACKGGVA